MDSSLFFSFCAPATFFTLMVYISIKLLKKFRFHQEDSITDASSSLSLSYPVSSLSRNWKHHVFPSFHGEDIRKNFLSHIQKEFKTKGIDQFLDDHIERSKSIGPELVEAIRGSKIAIVLFSKNYASSSWCLNELVEIMKCRGELGQTVMTVFYEVDPTDVKKQTGNFGKIFTKTCKGKTKEEIMRWKKALEGAATIAGEHSRNWDNEAAMIEKITTDVSNMLNYSTPSRDFEGLVGMEAHMKNMESLLRLDLDEVRMVGIWGPSGIGKTTIARFLFNQVSSSFQLSTIMVNIKGCYPRPCLDEYSTQLQLQQRMLSQMINQKDIVIPHLGIAEERLKNKKVFLVLDDVDRLEQLVALAKEIQWFGPGSRIIITTEDIRVLNAHSINHIYQVDFPSIDKAYQIFCMYAFGQKEPYNGFFRLAREAVELAGNLPLGLKVLGSYFRGMSQEEWVMALPRLNTYLVGEIESVLKFSYDGLRDEDKDLFLYIACFFNNQKITKVENHLAKRFWDVRQGIHVLTEKSLIDIRMGHIQMHNLLVQLGKKIARKQYYDDPRKHYFLVEERDICEALNYDTKDSRRVIGMDLNLSKITDEVSISEKAFERMSNLQFLRFNGGYNSIYYAMQGLWRYTKIRYLRWLNFPKKCLPSTLNPEFLIELDMSYSKLYKLWEGNKPLKNLKWMDLSFSKKLKELPDLSTATNLEDLNFKDCSSLVELPSIGNLIHLKALSLDGCSSLVKLPSSIGNLIHFQELNLRDCSSLVELPSSIGNLTHLKKLFLSYCSSLVELPSSIGNLTHLENLNLSYCSGLVELPSSIGNLTHLENLNLSYCSSLVELPSSIGNLTHLKLLYLNNCSSLVELPSSIGNLTNLYGLILGCCSNLVELPSSIGNLTLVENLDLYGCSSLVELPSSFENWTHIKKLNLIGCSSLVELTSSLGNMTQLEELNLGGCSSLVELPSSIGNLTHLNELILGYCSGLVELPSSIGNLTHLNELILGYCSGLVELPSSIGNLTHLENLNLSYCSGLVELPSSIGNLTHLENLNLSYCSSLVELPSSIGKLTHLMKLNFSYCSSLVELPSSIGKLIHLKKLNLRYCSNLVGFPSSIGNLTHLKKLILSYCSSLVELPSSIGNLTHLKEIYLNNCSSLVELPSSIGNLTHLYELYLGCCSSLVELPSSIGNLTRLQILNLSGLSSLVELPSSIGNLTSLMFFCLDGCSSLMELPPSIRNLTSLLELNLDGCSSLVKLTSTRNATNVQILNLSECSNPVEISSIRNATNLHQLNIGNCSSLSEVPNFIRRVNIRQEFIVYSCPPSVGNLGRLHTLKLAGCKKLEVLPDNINLKSLRRLDLTGCSQLKRFPDIATNTENLYLAGTAIEKVPSSVRSWPRLNYLSMQYFGNLNESPHAFDIITELHVSEDVHEVAPWVKEISRLSRFVLKNCKKLVSLPQLPDSLSHLDAENCCSLERLDCSFNNPKIRLNFTNCFKLNNKARELVMQAQHVIVPGQEVPAFFSHQATGVYGSDQTSRVYLTVNLNRKPLRTPLRFKTCIMLDKGNDESCDFNFPLTVCININGLGVPRGPILHCIQQPLKNHLHVLEVEAEEKVTPTKLGFEFSTTSAKWRIRQCGVLQIV